MLVQAEVEVEVEPGPGPGREVGAGVAIPERIEPEHGLHAYARRTGLIARRGECVLGHAAQVGTL